MPSLRTLTQPTMLKDRVVFLRDQCKPISENYHHHTRSLSKRSDSNGIKIDTECWIRSYCCTSQDSLDGLHGKYRLSRILNVGRNYFSKVNLRKRLAGVTCFHYKQHSDHPDESLPNPSTLRPYTSSGVPPQTKTYLAEDFEEKQDSKYGIRINVKPTSYDDALNDLSPTSTISNDDFLRPVRTMKKKRSKTRKVTTYYSSKPPTNRKPRAEVYYSVQKGKRDSFQECSLRDFSTDKKAVGRHLEWLKFLA
ncbi:hypothetical protein OnM2_102010 [Erysiphe neolycopersici]|uniref:Uncharacterized protein n=1 Tax=Erysiphe neolycopersici TaxID=212602 RepID=A0A420H8G8_9PEZI|nr:hypothetical protein OnM2_102010 [Erysiphe neolycopersici]